MTTGSFDDKDVKSEVGSIAVTESAIEKIGPYLSGDAVLTSAKASIFKVLSSDPDAVLGLMAISVSRQTALAKSLLSNLNEIKTLLDSVTSADSTIDENILFDVIDGFESMTSGQFAEKKHTAQKLKIKVKTLIASFSRDGAPFAGEKDPDEVISHIIDLAVQVGPKLKACRDLSEKFLDAIAGYLESGLFLSAVETQASAVATKLKGHTGKSGINVAKALLTATVGLALIDERLTIRNPLDLKYEGSVSIQPGTAAHLTGTKSLPLNTSGATVALTVDSTSRTLTIAASTPAVISAIVPSTKVVAVPAPPEGEAQTSSPIVSLYPITGTSKFRILIDNTTYTATVSSAINDQAGLVTALNSALSGQGVGVTASGDYIVFTRSALGSSRRIAFYDTANAGVGENDLNTIFKLTYSRLGSAMGADSDINDISGSGFTVTSAAQLLTDASAQITTSGSNHVVTFTEDITAKADDKCLIENSYYNIVSVAGKAVTLSGKVLQPFDGSTLTTTEPRSVVAKIIREYVTVSSTSTTWGTTSISAVSPNELGIPSSATTNLGIHSKFKLSKPASLGSPIRIGDLIAKNDTIGQVFGVVQASSADGIFVHFLSDIITMPTNNLRIYPRGAWYFKNAVSDYRLAFNNLEYPDVGRFVQHLGVYLASGSSRYLVEQDLEELISAATLLSELSKYYVANIPNSVNLLLRALTENKMDVLKNLLVNVDFRKLLDLKAMDLAEVTQISAMLDEVASSLGGNKDFAVVSSAETAYTFNFVPDQTLLEYPSSVMEE